MPSTWKTTLTRREAAGPTEAQGRCSSESPEALCLESVRHSLQVEHRTRMPHTTGLKFPVTLIDRCLQGCRVGWVQERQACGRFRNAAGPPSYDAGDPASLSAEDPRKALCSLWQGATRLSGTSGRTILSSADNCSPFERQLLVPLGDFTMGQQVVA